MGQLPYRRTSTRGLRGAALALLCLLGLLIAPAAATAQATTGGAKAPAVKTATTEPDATDAVTTPAAGADAAATGGPDAGATPPPAGGTTPDVPAADPTAPAADPAADPAAVDPATPAATPDAQNPAQSGTETAQTTGVVVQEPDDSLPGWVWGAVAVGIVAAALVAWLLVLASGRFERLAPVGHALGEAGWRLSNRWSEFMDWLRFGSGR